MLIDGFTVGAQAVNFLVLVALLRRFLYGPILAAIDAREARVAAELADAAAKQEEAAKARASFAAQSEDLARQRDALLAQATTEARAEGDRMLEAARREADALAARRRAAWEDDSRAHRAAWDARIRQEVFAIARKALGDLADADLEARMCDVFVARLRGIDGPAKALLADALKRGPEPPTVRSAFALPEAQRAAVRRAVDDTFGPQPEVRFDTAPDLGGGIELEANGQKVAWSIAEYVAALERSVDPLLDSPADSVSPGLAVTP